MTPYKHEGKEAIWVHHNSWFQDTWQSYCHWKIWYSPNNTLTAQWNKRKSWEIRLESTDNLFLTKVSKHMLQYEELLLNDAERTTYWYGEGWNLSLTSYFLQNSTQTGSKILLTLETDRRKQERYLGYKYSYWLLEKSTKAQQAMC